MPATDKSTVAHNGNGNGHGKPAATELIPQAHGGALLPGGVPGNKGGAGRPPNWLRDWCDDLLAKEENKAEVEAVLGNNKHPAFATMWKAIAERAHGKPDQRIMASTDTMLRIVVVSEDGTGKRCVGNG